MAIPDHLKSNFHTLCDATVDGRTAILQTIDKQTGEMVVLVCISNVDPEDGEMVMTPVAIMMNDPSEAFSRYDPQVEGTVQ